MKTNKKNYKTMGERSPIFKTATLYYCKCPILTKKIKIHEKQNRKDGSNITKIATTRKSP